MSFPKVFWYFTWGFFFNNCAFNVLSQLQSSINPTVGPISLSLQFASSIIVCLIIAPILFSTTGARFQFTVASLGYLVYAVANFVPSWYTLIPAAIILGFATGISWAGATLFVPTIVMSGSTYFIRHSDITVLLIKLFYSSLCYIHCYIVHVCRPH